MNVTGQYDPHWSYSGKWANATGFAGDYTYDPAGVNPTYVKYLASKGILGNGDPLSTSDVKAIAGGNFGNFWKQVFPMGNNDCDLQAAIQNMTDKVTQLEKITETPVNAGAGLVATLSNNGIVNYVQNPALGLKGGNCQGCQGDAAAYISNSYGNLKALLAQYNAEYARRVAKGGGCSHGTSTTNFTTLQQQTRAASVQIANDVAAAQAALALQQQEQQTNAGSKSVGGSGLSPVTIGLIGGGVLLFVIVSAVVLKKPKTA